MNEKLAGRNSVTASDFTTANQITMTKFTAVASGTATEILTRVKASTTGTITAGIYTDSSGSPAARIAAGAFIVPSGVERDIPIVMLTPVSLVSGTVYWLAFNSSVSIVGYKTETAVSKYKAAAFTDLPDPAGSGYSNLTTSSSILSAWNIRHLIISPNLKENTILYNNVIVFSEDDNKNLLIGTASSGNGDKILRVQRNDLKSQDDVDDCAAAILAKLTRKTYDGYLQAPINCGQELYDVIRVNDTVNPTAINYRVLGYSMEINPMTGKHTMSLKVGGV